MNYHITKKVDLSYDQALEKVTAELKKEGFGVLTEIDVKATLKEKLDIDFRRYTILGACNPALAHRAIEADNTVGVLMPCNVCVYEDGGGNVMISAMDPGGAMEVVGNPDIREVGREARARMERVMEAV